MLHRIAVLLICITANVCIAQTHNSNRKPHQKYLAALHEVTNQNEPNEGIVYFSFDNGKLWKNASTGLPQKMSIGLGGIAASANQLGLFAKEHGVYLYDFKKSVWNKIPVNAEMLKKNPGAMIFYKDQIFVGTQYGGIYYTNNQGKSWVVKNTGLSNVTARRFAEIDNVLYLATNSGLYSYNEAEEKWNLEYGEGLQVNGITESGKNIYIATDQGAYKSFKKSKTWISIFPKRSLHNISAIDNIIYAMVYNELFYSPDEGNNWYSAQKGLPKDLYTFNVIKNSNTVFAAQWDGIYSRTASDGYWNFSSNGLPPQFAVTNLKAHNNILVISTSQRKLKDGVTVDR